MVEAHGSFSIAHCVTCGKEYSAEFIKGMHQRIFLLRLVDYVFDTWKEKFLSFFIHREIFIELFVLTIN